MDGLMLTDLKIYIYVAATKASTLAPWCTAHWQQDAEI